MVSYEEFENRLRRECVGDTKKTPPLSFATTKFIIFAKGMSSI